MQKNACLTLITLCAVLSVIYLFLDAQEKLAQGLVDGRVTLADRFTLVYNLDIELTPPSIKKVSHRIALPTCMHSKYDRVFDAHYRSVRNLTLQVMKSWLLHFYIYNF